MTSEER
jgi:choline transporter-like protein 2/4/5